ncbi:MAG: hypothetical protein CMO61_04320 [Verrucomicrobiales bacterium]|jgi:ankyrin repeat protein|nr:hypothetical protein [Verrucomicrobiales bacterium]
MNRHRLSWLPTIVIALFLASCGGEKKQAEESQAAGVEAETEVPTPKTIDEAIARGNIEAVKSFIAADPNAASSGARPGSPPLHQAILRQKSDIALLLITSGADVNAVDSSRRTPLHLCVERDLADLVAPLTEAGAKPDEKDPAGWTPLHHTGAKDRVAVAKALLENGADVNIRSELGGTPLHEAAASASAELVKILLDAGVDASIVADGGSALDIAKEFENEAAIKLLSEAK